jgi:predicted nucleic acid-binding protein
LSSAVISTQVINEVSANLLKKFGFQENSIMEFIHDCYRRYEVGNIGEYVFSIASDIRSKTNYSYYDSLILASAIDAKCEILYSEDMQHNHAVAQGLMIINPFV